MISERKSQRDIRRFSRWSDRYDDAPVQRFFGRVHERMLGLLEETDARTVLDVGCGTGRLLLMAASRWPAAQLIGVDPAEGMIEVARTRTPHATFHIAPAESLPVPSSSVDIALSSISFHHWRDQALGLVEIARVLRPGGQLCLADPAMPALVAKLLRSNAKSPTALFRLYANAGLKVKTQRSILAGFVFATVGQNE